MVFLVIERKLYYGTHDVEESLVIRLPNISYQQPLLCMSSFTPNLASYLSKNSYDLSHVIIAGKMLDHHSESSASRAQITIVGWPLLFAGAHGLSYASWRIFIFGNVLQQLSVVHLLRWVNSQIILYSSSDCQA